MVLRIEDTDRERSTPENVEQILDALRWLELDWDEGPLSQYERANRHRQALEQLLTSGAAYRDSATGDDVAAWKKEHGNRGYRGEPTDDPGAAVRLRIPEGGDTVVLDEIRGEVRFPNEAQDDFVIARGDGSVLYNFAVAVDDADMGITHVIRGDDHLSNTPKQLLVMDALEVAPPLYAHLPLLHGPDGKKLSKRHGAASVQELREGGYLPPAVRNYIALLGWGTQDDTTILSTEELIERFDVADVGRASAIFDEQKLRWLNGRYLRALDPADLTRRLERFTGRDGLGPAVAIAQEKLQTLADFWPLVGFVYDGPGDDPKARERWLDPGGREILAEARERLANVEEFDITSIERTLRDLVSERGVKPGEVFQPLRVAIAGQTTSPGIFETVALVGRDETLRRIDAALAR